MQALAAIGDAPTAAIAVVAILLGLFFAARGPRDKRAAGAEGSGDEQDRHDGECRGRRVPDGRQRLHT